MEYLKFISFTYYLALIGTCLAMFMQPEMYFKFGSVALFSRALFHIVNALVYKNESSN